MANSSSEKIIITSALPYVNGVKHLGNLIGSLLPADIYARYLRLLKKDVIAICGTDEHGTPAEISALEEGIPVAEYAEKYYEIQKRVYKEFGLSFDYFGRTSSKENHEITQHLFLKLKENGLITEKTIVQLFCQDHKRFLPDRFIEGTCPECGYERARGDQCENCTKVLDAVDLIEPKSKICGGSNIVEKKSKHLFLNLPKIQDRIGDWVETKTHWPKTTKSIAKKWIKEGLRERSITRDLEWGVSVPLEGYEDKVFYVWFDAPIGYIGITKEWSNKIGKPDLWQDYWKNPRTRLIQFMAKDNVPFHTVTWPASMMGADDGFVLADMIKGFQWLNFEGGKFSTSECRGVFTDDALKLFPADLWRYYLVLIAPERHDTDFLWSGFQNAVNQDLSNVLGNFIHRTLTFLNRNFDSQVPSQGDPTEEDRAILNRVKEARDTIKELLDNYEFQKSIQALRALWVDCNRYFQGKEPWKLVKDDPKAAATCLSICAHLCRSIAILGAPFIPFSSEKIYKYFSVQKNVHEEDWDSILDFNALVGSKVSPEPKPLFEKIDSKKIEELAARFAGVREEEEFIDYSEFEKVKLVVVEISQVERVSGTAKLLKLSLNDGSLKSRQIITGLADQYAPEELVGKKAIVVANLQPKKIQGIESCGMILAAEHSDQKKKYSVIYVHEDVPVGSRIL